MTKRPVTITVAPGYDPEKVFNLTAETKQNTNDSAKVTVTLTDGTQAVTVSENLYGWVKSEDDGLWHSHLNAVPCPAGSRVQVLIYRGQETSVVAEEVFSF